MAFISYTERPISALSSVGEARAGLIWVDFIFVMSQQAPIRWSLNSWAAQANHGHPTQHSAVSLFLFPKKDDDESKRVFPLTLIRDTVMVKPPEKSAFTQPHA